MLVPNTNTKALTLLSNVRKVRAVSTLLAQRPGEGVGHARQAAGMHSAKVDGVRVAVASLLGGTIPPLVESATALLRDVDRAGGQRS